MNKKGFAISGIVYSVLILFLLLVMAILGILGSRKIMLDKLKNQVVSELNNEYSSNIYKDDSGANYPRLLDNMIPVIYDEKEDTWVYADIYEKWYDYNEQMWANAVVLNNGITKTVGQTISEEEIALMYVWIPRYKYVLFNAHNEGVPEQLIDVIFEKNKNTTGTVKCVDAINQTDVNGNAISEICTDTTNGDIVNNISTYTHPAFTFGEDEIEGFWIGKFEVSGTIDEVTIKPNVKPIVSQTVSIFFEAIQDMTNAYGLNGDSHMMKNMEWGAVAYLKQSKYGLGTIDIGINNYYNSELKTGCGAASGSSQSTTCNSYDDRGKVESTTGNIYGVYGMSGGATEYVMANMVDSNGKFDNNNRFFSTTPETKYYDLYTYDAHYLTHARGKLGDATKETLAVFGEIHGAWKGDYPALPANSYSWFHRGGDYSNGSLAGIFTFSHWTGAAAGQYSARAVLIKE